jgi:transposase
MATTYLGIDVSKKKLDVAFMKGCDVISHYTCCNNQEGYQQIHQWSGEVNPAEIHVCLEATGQYSQPVAEYLHGQGYAVSLVNPVCIKNYARSQLRRNKTDKLDAGLIADFCRARHPMLWSPVSAQNKALKALSRRVEDLKALKQQETNRLSSGETNDIVVGSILAVVSYLELQIKEVEQEIREMMRNDPDLRAKRELLLSIPCIGERTATVILAEIPDATRFKSARQLAANVGLTPEICESGSSIHKKPRMSKKGNAGLRKALYMPAVVGKNHNPIIQAFCERLEKNGKKSMVVIGAAMRKLIHIVYGVLKSGKPFDPNYLSKPQFAT